MRELCEGCRAICPADTEPEHRFCCLDFTCRHSFLFENGEDASAELFDALKRNMRDWKNWLRQNEETAEA